jgi:hypothetical protein
LRRFGLLGVLGVLGVVKKRTKEPERRVMI